MPICGGIMLIKKLGAAYIILLILTSSVLTIPVSSDDSEPSTWNRTGHTTKK